MKKATAILMVLVSMTAVAQTPKAAAKKSVPQQCAVSMPTPDGKSQSVVVDCSVYVLINYLQQQITQLQGSKLDKVDPATSTRALAHTKATGEI